MSKKVIINAKGIEYAYTYDSEVPDNLHISHCHDHYEILFVVSGNGKYIVEGSSFNIRPSTLIVIRPFEYHSVILEATAVYERYCIKFSEHALVDEARALLMRLMQDSSVSGKYFPAAVLPHAVYSLFERFDLALSLSENERSVYVKMLLSELIILLSAEDGEAMHHEEEELGARVIRYLNENINRDVSLDKLAKRFFVSKYYLCRAFKKHNGITVHGYINFKRVMIAKQLIEGGETASGAAYRVGFGDYSSFYRAYVKIVGTAPTAVLEGENG